MALFENLELIIDFNNYQIMKEIYELKKNIDHNRKKIIQYKFHRTEKGIAKMHRNNEKRRNKRNFNKCLKEFLALFEQLSIFS